ncbi:S-adenosyl-L-methionine-dependent methyltransferase [Fistulina hepatica ATCC 64428]|uniref:S-adenosyl-L-methionine-dependent methyltransferase n=1 Tax=Fistulina hepatica ATCC 64428 TaxID=1128425 RepID=A0A0D7ABP5_9AGAR|nr:S-adenosyl-L-methionine-dependent methyltransferase [Fistulina hepatica ATCC 64428]
MSAYMTDAFLDLDFGHSEDGRKSALALAFKTDKTLFEWYEEPENLYRHKRYEVAMTGSVKLDVPDAILRGFRWDELPPNARVVDVGGGIGHITMTIARQNPNLRYVIQDRPSVIHAAEEYWKINSPEALDNGLVKLQSHDILSPQPVTDATVFLLRLVIHAFGSSEAIRILSHLCASAGPDTKLVLVEQVIPYACPIHEVSDRLIAGADDLFPIPPPPLENMGRFSSMAYMIDLQMACSLNAEERTLGSWVQLCRAAGWDIVRVYPISGSVFSHIVAVPV